MKLFKEVCSSSLGLPPDTFILAIAGSVFGKEGSTYEFSIASSNNSLTSIEYSRANGRSVTITGKQNKVHKDGITCLQALVPSFSQGNNSAATITAGREGAVKVWDLVSSTLRLALETPNGQGISAISHYHVSKEGVTVIAAGTELLSAGPGDVAIYVWRTCPNLLNNQAPSQSQLLLSIVESHTDTITNLSFHVSASANATDSQEPSAAGHSVHLLSSSTDGLINIIDPNIPDEEDAVLTVLNNKSAVQHFLPYNGTDHRFMSSGHICAITQDEKMSVHAVAESNSDTESSDPIASDLRESLQCDYTIGLKRDAGGGRIVLAVGAHKEETTKDPHVDLYAFAQSPFPSRRPALELTIRLQGGHGEEVVRDVWFDDDCPFILSCGEDGHLRVWEEEIATVGQPASKEKKKRKKGRKEEDDGTARFKPY